MDSFHRTRPRAGAPLFWAPPSHYATPSGSHHVVAPSDLNKGDQSSCIRHTYHIFIVHTSLLGSYVLGYSHAAALCCSTLTQLPLSHQTDMSDSASSAYLDGYPFKGEVLGLVNLEPCTNFTEMFQNFNYTDPENPSSGGATVELTNALNYTQLGAFPTPGYSIDDLPSNDMDLFPWTVQDGTVFGAEVC